MSYLFSAVRTEVLQTHGLLRAPGRLEPRSVQDDDGVLHTDAPAVLSIADIFMVVYSTDLRTTHRLLGCGNGGPTPS